MLPKYGLVPKIAHSIFKWPESMDIFMYMYMYMYTVYIYINMRTQNENFSP